jgi:hypothetical protein
MSSASNFYDDSTPDTGRKILLGHELRFVENSQTSWSVDLLNNAPAFAAILNGLSLTGLLTIMKHYYVRPFKCIQNSIQAGQMTVIQAARRAV